MPTSQVPASMPSADDFAFKAPFPALKNRRVSLALPSAPRIVQPWCFRDDTSIDHQPEKRGKMRRIAPGPLSDDTDTHHPEKKPRKKWSPEETQMLVDGCQRVRHFSSSLLLAHLFPSTALATGKPSLATQTSSSTTVRPLISKTGNATRLSSLPRLHPPAQLPHLLSRCIQAALSQRPYPSLQQGPLHAPGRHPSL